MWNMKVGVRKKLPATLQAVIALQYALVRMIGQVFTQSEDCIYPLTRKLVIVTRWYVFTPLSSVHESIASGHKINKAKKVEKCNQHKCPRCGLWCLH